MTLGACGSSSGSSSSDSSSDSSAASSSANTNLSNFINTKIEIDSALKDFAKQYEEETGQEVVIESLGGGVDVNGQLKNYYAAGNMPDIFAFGPDSYKSSFSDWLEPLDGEDWIEDTDYAFKGDDGKVYGMPFSLEGIGLAYNKDILDKAGIDPSTLTNIDAYKAAFEKIDGMKDELGLTSVCAVAAESGQMYWSTGNHLFANYLDAGLDRDDTTYIDMLNDGGKVDEERLTDFANFVGLLNQYSDPALLVSGTYDQQILNFSSGKYAFVTQGSWIGATMTGDDADAYKEAGNFEVGMIPYAFEDGIDTILTNSPSWWSVYKDGNVEAAEAFLQWLTTDEAQEVLVKEAGFVSPFKSCTIVGDDPFAQTITDYVSSGKTSAWHWLGMKEGLAQNYTGQVFADYASGSLDEAGFVKTLEQVIQGAYAN